MAASQGRKREMIVTKTVTLDELPAYLGINIIKSMIDIGDGKYTLLMYKNINQNYLSKLNIDLSTNIKDFEKLVKCNVGIASAITSYARIFMIPFKIDGSVVYTDTDSIFTTRPLPLHLIGKELGLFKDELNGLIIKEAYFLGVKQYGYWYLDENGHRIEKSVWAGITRNTITFQEIVDLYNHKKVVKTNPTRFFKSLIKLSISIKSTVSTIEFNTTKKLVDNIYQPISIYKLGHNDSLLRKLIYYIKKYLNKHFLILLLILLLIITIALDI